MNFCPEMRWGGEGAPREKYKPSQVTNNKAIILTFAEKKSNLVNRKEDFRQKAT